MANRKTLMQYQTLLVEFLDSDRSPAQIIEELRNASDLVDYREYIESFDEDMIAVAKALVAKWSQRSETIDPTSLK